MAPAIRVDDQVWTWLKSHARPLEDTPNSVLRRLAGLETDDGTTHTHGSIPTTMPPAGFSSRHRRVRSGHTPQVGFRDPILLLLHHHGGQMERLPALRGLEEMLGRHFTDADRSDIQSGTVRWQKSAEWQIHTMRCNGLLEPVQKSGSGVWKLSQRGAALAADLAAKAAS
jgi:hypothetical protein